MQILNYILRVVTACPPFHPRQEFPELDGVSHGNSDDAPADAYRAVLGMGGRLQQLNANVGKSDMNEEPKSCNLERVHHLSSGQHMHTLLGQLSLASLWGY